MAADASKLVGYAVTGGIPDDEASVSRLTGYAVTSAFPVDAVTVSKLVAHIVTSGFPLEAEAVSKIGPYAITGGFPVNAESVSKFYAYAITIPGTARLIAVGQAVETDEALRIARWPPLVTQAVETDEAFPITHDEGLAAIVRRANGALLVMPPVEECPENDTDPACKEDELRDAMNERIHGTDAKSRLEAEMEQMTQFVNKGRNQPGAAGHSISASLRYLLGKKP